MSSSDLRTTETKIDVIVNKDKSINNGKILDSLLRNVVYRKKDKITLLVYKNDGEIEFNTVVYNGEKIIFTVSKERGWKNLKVTYVGDRVIKETTKEYVYYKLYRGTEFICYIVTYRQ